MPERDTPHLHPRLVRLRQAPLLGALLGLAWLLGCPGRIEDPDRFQACSLDVEEDIFRQTCGTAGCHIAGPNAAAGLDLSSPDVASRLVNQPSTCNARLLLAGPSDGYLLEKVFEATPTCGARMPAEGSLTDEELRCLRLWAATAFDGGTP